ncbi:hypothetical protein FM114_11475 [Luteococcus japonicus LSP_Lj1]|uniref:Uncharacterized protein n=2 Tax=Luteococcus japonicus TaxID=33984 RepID=A0A1R4K4N7_9ACTN|nr:hypothetical protein FM114_11475 [Luteococcus japonicus LSP_Lj1]
MAATADRRELAKLLHLDVPTVDLLLTARDKLPGRTAEPATIEPTQAKLTSCPGWCDGHTPDEAAEFTAGAAQFHDKVLWDGAKHGTVSVAQYAPAVSEDDGTEELPYVNFWVADVAGLGYDDTKAMIDALKVAQGLVDGLRALNTQTLGTTKSNPDIADSESPRAPRFAPEVVEWATTVLAGGEQA